MMRQMLESLFAKAPEIKVLVVGDLMIDEYLWGSADRISPEAPVQVVDVKSEELRLGGAGNVVNNLKTFGCSVSVASVIGKDDIASELFKAFSSIDVETSHILEDGFRRTGKKTRVIASHQQIVRVDRESRHPLAAETESAFISILKDGIDNSDIIVISDYMKGVLTDKVLSFIIAEAEAQNKFVVVDPKGSDYKKYSGASILTPNRKEAEAASAVSITDDLTLNIAARKIMDDCNLKNLLITRSEEGMSLFSRDGSVCHLSTTAREVFDVSGAGDTVIAALSLGIAAGLSLSDAARTANAAAGIAVGKLGTATVTPEEVISEVSRSQADSSSKIKTVDVLKKILAKEREKGKKVVFTNGCFDLLHLGHVRYLQKARSLGDLLVLGLNSDASIKRLKGENRPLIAEEERAHILAALDCIDYVLIFDDDTPIKLIEAILPDILAKGGDYTREGVVGHEIVEKHGGRVELITFVDGKSTTGIIEKILETYR